MDNVKAFGLAFRDLGFRVQGLSLGIAAAKAGDFSFQAVEFRSKGLQSLRIREVCLFSGFSD